MLFIELKKSFTQAADFNTAVSFNNTHALKNIMRHTSTLQKLFQFFF